MLYDALGLYKGAARTFTNEATPFALLKRGWKGLNDVRVAAANYRPIEPVAGEEFATYTQQGGILVLDGDVTRLAWRDGGTADHVRLKHLSCIG